ncbi:MAG TPA: PDR/VanB family oxidoreductase [Vicinamibacterales bacterium]|nr:PDR/VanB family oxidoreductase [Vicinamibacterales bacterium]
MSIELVVTCLTPEAQGVLGIELRHPTGEELPLFEPGAHVEVRLSNGIRRQYSLCNDSRERTRYCLGIGHAPESRGGSRYLHNQLKLGDRLQVAAPKNLFPLRQGGEELIFIAGGIGITPILSMIRHCLSVNRPFHLYYCARSRTRAGFLQTIEALAGARAHFHFDDEHDGRWFDAKAIVSRHPREAHVYCCGPEALMKAVQEAGADRPAENLHFEWFSPKPNDDSKSQPFEVVIRSSGRRIHVPADRSVLDVLEGNGVSIPTSCREGLCGTCQVGVVAGLPDHRDSVLSDDERAANQSMMICVSRSRTPVLELDL